MNKEIKHLVTIIDCYAHESEDGQGFTEKSYQKAQDDVKSFVQSKISQAVTRERAALKEKITARKKNFLVIYGEVSPREISDKIFDDIINLIRIEVNNEKY